MTLDSIASVSLSPAAEALSLCIEYIYEIVAASKDVLMEKESFKELTVYLERIVPIIRELTKKKISNSESLNNAIEILNREVKDAKQLTLECGKKSKVYLLMNCRKIARRLEITLREISRALSLLPLASLDISAGISADLKCLCHDMEKAEFRATVAGEEILEKVESGIQERKADRSYANNLLNLIAEAVGISTDKSSLKKELVEFRHEIENARLRKDQAEAIQMDQIIALLERADAASSLEEKETKYFRKRSSLGSQPLEPLQSFYCPITRDVMMDPVETSSGHTFERSAIEKWFSDGNNLCPLTLVPLDTSVLRPNKTLRQSIEEWKDRNNMIAIASIKRKLKSANDEELQQCLDELHDLCEQRDVHREWVLLENYAPILIELLGSKNRDVRNLILEILYILAKDTDDAKERIASATNAIEFIVRSLGRRVGERKLGVALLSELSKCNSVRDRIGKVQGCILLLVTMASSDDSQAARDAQDLLDTLSFSNDNVIQMAKANFFKYLLFRLSSGPDNVKVTMAKVLADMELTDHNKTALVEGGVLSSLLRLVSDSDIGVKEVAAKALLNLSTSPKNGIRMIKEGAVAPLLKILIYHATSSPGLHEEVASIIKNLAMSVTSQDTGQTEVSLFENEDDIHKLFSLINFNCHNVQESILYTFYALCQSPSGNPVKNRLIQYSALPTLVQLCESEKSHVRANAVKLFCCLVEDANEAIILQHVGEKFIETLLKIIKASDDDEEIASALEIISALPESPLIDQWLLDKGAFSVIFNYLLNARQNDPQKNKLIEEALGAICRFTGPTNEESQKKAAKAGLIHVLVQLLEVGTSSTKRLASKSLSQFSRSSVRLSRPIKRRKGFLCFSAPPEAGCPVHGGFCSVESSFCLMEAKAVGPLVQVLTEADLGACEASLDALLTLIEAERLQSGCKVLSEANAIPLMIRFLSSSSPTLQEKSLHALERIFRLPEFKQKYGPSAQMPLVDLTQRGSSSMKSLSARILAHLNVLHDQSSYF